MKTALAQINTTIGDFNGNLRKAEVFIKDAKKNECDLIVFPELALCGYPPGDLLERRTFIDRNLAAFHRIRRMSSGIGIICGYVDHNPDPLGKPLVNAVSLLSDGKVLGTAHKQLLPMYDVFDERRYFAPGEPSEPVWFRNHRIGLTICEDVWNDKDFFEKQKYSIDPVGNLARQKADMIIAVSASPFHTGKPRFREQMLGGIAKKYRLPICFANQVGGNDSLVFDGASMALDAAGKVVARAAGFEEDMVVFDSAKPGRIPEKPFIHNDDEIMYRALVLGVRDYVTKCGFQKAVVGLSGGVDSALTLCVGKKALGAENLRAVFMPSPFTSKDNFTDTAQLAKNLGVFLDVVPIDGIFSQFLKGIPGVCHQKKIGITEQNLQARIRGTILMAYANKQGSLVLSTGNKSEMSVGYCTLYGDMNGGLSVIADVWKTEAYRICRHINRDKEIIPTRIIEKAPSAELKPGQQDDDDLPPYEILDAILKPYIEKSKSADEIVAMGFEPVVVHDVVRRVVINEYKRRQAAPCIKVSAKAFGVGRRYPIAHRFRALPLEDKRL